MKSLPIIAISIIFFFQPEFITILPLAAGKLAKCIKKGHGETERRRIYTRCKNFATNFLKNMLRKNFAMLAL
jgi:hypothetical protein